jgi:hypothetical protein
MAELCRALLAHSHGNGRWQIETEKQRELEKGRGRIVSAVKSVHQHSNRRGRLGAGGGEAGREVGRVTTQLTHSADTLS